MSIVIGTAGWSIPSQFAAHFSARGSGLERYATRFTGVEINSSFYRPHRPATWVRWAESVPEGFRFAVKMPKTISHERRLVDCDDILAAFLEATSRLGQKRDILLLQLPPSFRYDAALFEDFAGKVRAATTTPLVCEPRHASWFETGADEALARLRVARVAADPAPVPAAAEPGGWRDLTYRRLHGSPRMYRSAYGDDRLTMIARDVANGSGNPSWCIFDNTASGAATGDALTLLQRLAGGAHGKGI